MTRHTEHLKVIEAYASSHGANTRRVKSYVGNPQASVAIVGWQMPEEDRAPFVSVPLNLVRETLSIMGVTPSMVFLTNVVKYWLSPDQVFVLADWKELLLREIEIVGPKAVIVLGGAAARCVLGGRGEMDRFRKTRFSLARFPQTTFFATYGPEELVRAQSSVRTARTLEFRSDLRAVFDVNQLYFAKSQTGIQ